MSSEIDSWKRQLEQHKTWLQNIKNSKMATMKKFDESIKNSRDASRKKDYREQKQRQKEHWDSQIRHVKKTIESHKFYKPKK
jgi:hypothetical protein